MAVRAWLGVAWRDAGTGHDGGMASADRRELAELRRESRGLREDVEILRRAAAIFATATGWMSSRSSRRRGQADVVDSLAETLVPACPPGRGNTE